MKNLKILVILLSISIIFIGCSNPISTGKDIEESVRFSLHDKNGDEVINESLTVEVEKLMILLVESNDFEQNISTESFHRAIEHRHIWFDGPDAKLYRTVGGVRYVYIYEVEYCGHNGCTATKMTYVGRIPLD